MPVQRNRRPIATTVEDARPPRPRPVRPALAGGRAGAAGPDDPGRHARPTWKRRRRRTGRSTRRPGTSATPGTRRRQSWDRLRAQIGGATLDAALGEPPLTVLALGPGADGFAPTARAAGPCPSPPRHGSAPVLLIPIAGQTYRALAGRGDPAGPAPLAAHPAPPAARRRPLLRLPAPRRHDPVRLRRVDLSTRRHQPPRPLQAPGGAGGAGVDLRDG